MTSLKDENEHKLDETYKISFDDNITNINRVIYIENKMYM